MCHKSLPLNQLNPLHILTHLFFKTDFSSLLIKPTDALNCSFINIMTLHVLGRVSAHHQEFLAIHRHWYILWSCDEPFATSCRVLPLVANGSSQLHKMYQCRCTAKNSWWWAERLPKTCRVIIPIKLEFSTSVGFINKESVTMHGHTIVKNWFHYLPPSVPRSPSWSLSD